MSMRDGFVGVLCTYDARVFKVMNTTALSTVAEPSHSHDLIPTRATNHAYLAFHNAAVLLDKETRA